jgi:hypothetical protein
MVEAKVNGKPVKIPSNWDEVTFGQFLKLIDCKDYTHILSVVLDMPPDIIAKADFVGLRHVYQALNFVQTQAPVEQYPKKLGQYEIPKDISFQSVGQFEALRTEIIKAQSSDLLGQTKALAVYAAIYCQPQNGDEFDIEKSYWLSESFMNYPCTEVMSAGSFFRDNLLSITSGLPLSYLRKSLAKRKSTQGWQTFLRRSGFTRLWTILRVMWERMTKKS